MHLSLKDIEKELAKHCALYFYGIVFFGSWVHPHNAVINCIAFMLDGGIQYKFSLTYDGKLLVAEVRDRHWVDLPIQVGDVLTYTKLFKLIKKAKYREVFGKDWQRPSRTNLAKA